MAKTKHQHNRVVVTTHPSLALLKYWGKKPSWLRSNIPATSSIAVNLSNCNTRIDLTVAPDATEHDLVYNKERQISNEIYRQSYAPFIQYLKHKLNLSNKYHISIDNDFPIAAGVASSSSIFAGITIAMAAIAGHSQSDSQLSALARHGSTSAARSVFGSWTILKSGRQHAQGFQVPAYWNNTRVIVVITSPQPKTVSSRLAMKRCQTESFAYHSWVRLSKKLFRLARTAINRCDFNMLGSIMQQSYSSMVATMMGCQPPIRYLNHDSIRILEICKQLRADGVLAWETMDAGPQVKIFTNAQHSNTIVQTITASNINCTIIDSAIGGAPHIEYA